MNVRRVNYDPIAPAYEERYAINKLPAIEAALLSLVQSTGARRILEVGCGTGRWLVELQHTAQFICGLDVSLGMLRQTQQRAALQLLCGRANTLPFAPAVFDLIFCVNALHHFDDPSTFVFDARKLIGPGGAFAIVGMDPHANWDRWFIYDYFTGTRDADLQRFPSKETIMDWMASAGFEAAEWKITERITDTHMGRAVLSDHFLQKHGTSQLALLSDEAYAAGIRKIESAIAHAEARGETIVFPVDISLVMVTGRTSN